MGDTFKGGLTGGANYGFEISANRSEKVCNYGLRPGQKIYYSDEIRKIVDCWAKCIAKRGEGGATALQTTADVSNYFVDIL
jgi:hypothetical protein